MKLSVCIEAVFAGMSPEKAIEKTAEFKIPAIEFWSWWDKDTGSIKKACGNAGIEIAAFCTPFISLVEPSCRKEYYESLRETIAVAKELQCSTIISQTGYDTGAERQLQHESLVEGLKMCAPMLEDAGITLAVEPLNIRVDHPGYYLQSSDECVEILREVDSSNVRMLFDVYHQQITEGDIIRRIREYAGYICHFHTAGNPGRHELYDSELDYRKVFTAIEAAGYNKYVGLEYFPLDVAEKGLTFAIEAGEGGAGGAGGWLMADGGGERRSW